MVEEVPDEAGSYRFVHALFREAAYDSLSAGERARLHRRAAERLERQHKDDLDRVVSELAHHTHRALAVVDPERAFAWAIRAAERASRFLAYEQAAAQLEPRIRVAKVNTEAAQALGGRYNIRSIPTLALFVGGREVARQPGAMTNPAQIVQWVQAHLPR